MKAFIKPNPPYNFNLVASLYSRFPTQCVDIYSEGEYKRVLRVENKLYFIRIKSVGSVDNPRLGIGVARKVGKRILKDKIKWIVGADDDIKSFYKIASKDIKFKGVINNMYGLRAPKTPTVYEALIIAITEQQIALPVAIALRKRLVERYADFIQVKGKKYYSFPTPKQLAEAKPEDIKKLKFSMKKAEYIVGVSKEVYSGNIDLEKMKDWKTEEVLGKLTKIRGIGPWTVEYMMCRGMGRYDALPASDMGLRNAVTRLLGSKDKASETEVRKLMKQFGKNKGIAAFYLIYWYAFQKYPQKRLV
jgi:DNA-3-methyladenine glycosylase II